MPATIEIDVHGRWDAVALMQRLNPYHAYLVQFAPERWLVHAECPGCHGESLPRALAALEESLAARHLGRRGARRRPALPAGEQREGALMSGAHVAETSSTRRLAQLFLVAAFVTASLLALRAPAARPSATGQARADATQVTVVMKEFRFILSTRSVHTGAVVFRLVNRGHLAHDFKMAGRKSALIAAGKRGLLRVVFRRPGRYPYVCTLPGHAQAGMKGVLKVTR